MSHGRSFQFPETLCMKTDWAESGLYEFWNIFLSRSCRNEKIVLLPSDYKSMFFKLSADIQFMPIINLDLVPDFGDFAPPIRQVSVQGFLALSRKVKESGPKFVENMLEGSCYHQI